MRTVPALKTLRLRAGEMGVSALLDLGFTNPSLRVDMEFISDRQLAIQARMLQRYWEQVGERKYIRYPTTVWDHIKQYINEGKDDFLKYLVSRMKPIRYTVETLEPRAVFKHADLVDEHRNNIVYYTVHRGASYE